MPQQVSIPRTSSELQSLIARRDALRDQLQSLRDERNGLAQQRLNAEARAQALGGQGNAQDRQIVRELEQRIDQLGARARGIEAQVDRLDDAITQARANGVEESGDIVGGPRAPNVPTPVISIPPMFDPGRDARMRSSFRDQMLAEGAVLVLLGAVACRMAWLAAKRKFLRAAGASPDLVGLRQSIDAIAVEVERISENQRYVTKLLSERGPRPGEERIEPPGKDHLKRL